MEHIPDFTQYGLLGGFLLLTALFLLFLGFLTYKITNEMSESRNSMVDRDKDFKDYIAEQRVELKEAHATCEARIEAISNNFLDEIRILRAQFPEFHYMLKDIQKKIDNVVK